MLTARNGIEDIVRGLESGADDVMSNPFDSAELEARIQALLRRRQGGGVWWLNPQGI
jgi:DNA-binding response OmpR family regulator